MTLSRRSSSLSTLDLSCNMLHDKSMTREPLPRFTASLTFTVDISARDEQEAEQRMDAVMEWMRDRCSRTTFKRQAGMPSIYHAEAGEVTPS